MINIGRKQIINSLLLLFVFGIAVFGQTRSELVKVIGENGKTEDVKFYDGSYALVIGVSDYTNGWRPLPGVKSDVAAIKSALEKHHFAVDVLMNPNRKEILDKIASFKENYGYAPNNRLVIYFAGHGDTGESADGRKLGYIIPVDAPAGNKNSPEFKRKTITMEEIRSIAVQIETKHVLFVFDSCFSGNLLSRGNIEVSPFVLSRLAKPSRQFLTSGSESQTVPDESEFRRLFVEGLEGFADEDKDGVVLGSELAKYIDRKLTNSSNRTQTPQYGTIKDSRLDKGDMIFLVENSKDGIPVIDLSKNAKLNRPLPPEKINETLFINKYTKTRICPNTGEKISINADGIITLGSNIKDTGPEGKDTFQPFGSTPFFGSLPVAIDKKYYLEKSFPLGALLCRFDYENSWSYCSVSKIVTAEKSGCLEFEINDKDQNDNAGAYRVIVKAL